MFRHIQSANLIADGQGQTVLKRKTALTSNRELFGHGKYSQAADGTDARTPEALVLTNKAAAQLERCVRNLWACESISPACASFSRLKGEE
jgi:hypothetical protein